ncbi:MAG: tyrosine-type recombinase/integrase [Chloroflexota bacterium]
MPHPPLMLTHNGETLSIREWAARTGIDRDTLRVRVSVLGWDAGRALTTQPDKRFRRGGRPASGAPRPVPKLRRHEATGRAFARWRAGGRDHTQYFGAWGSDEARTGYRQFAAGWDADGAPAASSGGSLIVAELVTRREEWAHREYRKAGRLTSEYHCQRAALAVLLDLYGETDAAGFDPARFRAVRSEMVAKGWARRTCNHHAARVVAAFKWAAGEGWLPAAVPDALRHVGGLKRGKTTAPDHPKRKPVPDADLAATLPHLSPFPDRAAWLGAMVRVQRRAGMRPADICAIRPRDIDRSGDVWVYTVRDEANKNAHRDRPLRYYLGPLSQADLSPYLAGPADRPAFRITANGYGNAVRKGSKRAGVTPWTPHQLRHAAATDAAREAGTIEAAADLIGDTVETARKHYVHVDPAERAKIEWARDRG